jgi:hypothetical protein
MENLCEGYGTIKGNCILNNNKLLLKETSRDFSGFIQEGQVELEFSVTN